MSGGSQYKEMMNVLPDCIIARVTTAFSMQSRDKLGQYLRNQVPNDYEIDGIFRVIPDCYGNQPLEEPGLVTIVVTLRKCTTV